MLLEKEKPTYCLGRFYRCYCKHPVGNISDWAIHIFFLSSLVEINILYVELER